MSWPIAFFFAAVLVAGTTMLVSGAWVVMQGWVCLGISLMFVGFTVLCARVKTTTP